MRFTGPTGLERLTAARDGRRHVIDKDGTPYSADIRGALKGYARGALKGYADGLFDKKGYTLNAANEIEVFLFAGPNAERRYHETGKFEYVNTGGYCHSLPGDPFAHPHRRARCLKGACVSQKSGSGRVCGRR